MKKKSIPRYTGVPEFWFNEKENKIVIRDNKHHCHLLRMSQVQGREWEMCFFKKPYSFDFYNGSEYLVEKGYELIMRINPEIFPEDDSMASNIRHLMKEKTKAVA